MTTKKAFLMMAILTLIATAAFAQADGPVNWVAVGQGGRIAYCDW